MPQMLTRTVAVAAAVLLLSTLSACGQQAAESPEPVAQAAPPAPAPVAAPPDAPAESPREFLERTNLELATSALEASAASWVNSTYITDDTALLAARTNARQGMLINELIAESRAFDGADVDAATRRDLSLLLRADYMPEHMSLPTDPEKLTETTSIQRRIIGLYGAGRYCPDGEDSCKTLAQLSDVLALSRDYDEQLEAWVGWRTVSPAMRPDYARLVELTTEGAKELGYNDMGDMWRSGYDMTADQFAAETERLWGQVEPLYEQLHCYVRDRLADHYGEDKVPRTSAIPAHLLGNMWAQQWSGIFDLVAPYPAAEPLDVTAALVAADYDALKMTQASEGFFTSLGMPALPETFWERSMITRPRDRDVVCHASAWNMDPPNNDVRIKQCVVATKDQFETLHHELGHVYYYLAYNHLGYTHRKGAHDGFHEGIGDTLILSMTPGYYEQIGLIEGYADNDEALINQQMKLALDKIAFLPFSKLVDQWRWGVFAGETPSDQYNSAWWALRLRYQGVAPPVNRSEQDFDAGAKFHVPKNTPYTRYFLAHILQFQFHQALCEAAGHEGPLASCSIYGSEAAGKKLWEMMRFGTSQPWQDTLEAAIGTREMDASAIIDYFAPLIGWLEIQNEGRTCGW